MMSVSTLKSTFAIVVPSRGQRMGPYASACWNVSPPTVENSRSPDVGSSAFSRPCSKNIPRHVGHASTEVSPNDFVARAEPSRGQFIASSSRRRPLDRQLQHHRSSDAFDRGDGDLSAVRLDDLFDDIEAEAGAGAAAERLAAALLVLLPDLGELAGLD